MQADTKFFVNVVYDVVCDWELLDAAERKAVLSALDDARPDARWARALVLTCLNPPAEIVDHLLGSSDALRSMLSRRSDPVDRRMLEDCVRICEDVGSIADLTATEAFWRLIVRLSAEPQSPLFVRALRLCLNGYTGKLTIEDWTRRIWLKLCCEADEERQEVLFQQLMEATITNNSGHFGALWCVLLAVAKSAATIERWVEQLDYYVEAIDAYNNMDIFLLHERVAPTLCAKIPFDVAWFRLSQDARSEEEMRLLVDALYTDETPRLRQVHDEVLEAIRAEGPKPSRDEPEPDPLAERVRAARLKSFDTGHLRRREVREAMHRPVEDWTWRSDIADEEA